LLGCSWHLSQEHCLKGYKPPAPSQAEKHFRVSEYIISSRNDSVWKQLGNTLPTGRVGAPKDSIQPITCYTRALLFPGAGQQSSWSTDGHPYGGNGVLLFFSS